jgi:hypothetical protein
MSLFDTIAFPLREHARRSGVGARGIVLEKMDMVGWQGAEESSPVRSSSPPRRPPAAALAAAGPATVDGSVVSATQDAVEALYADDYRDSDGSVEGKLAVLTGELRERYETDLAAGGIIDTYEQVSATTSYEVLDIGLQRINEAQDSATMVVFGAYVVDSVNSDRQEAPEGSECRVTSGGAQSCTQTVQVSVVQVDGEWKISDLTLLTPS